MDGDEAAPNVSPAARVAFWFSAVSLVVAVAVLVSAPTMRMTASNLMLWSLAAFACALAAIIVTARARSPLRMRIAGFVVGGLSVAAWGLLVWGSAILSAGSGQFVR